MLLEASLKHNIVCFSHNAVGRTNQTPFRCSGRRLEEDLKLSTAQSLLQPNSQSQDVNDYISQKIAVVWWGRFHYLNTNTTWYLVLTVLDHVPLLWWIEVHIYYIHIFQIIVIISCPKRKDKSLLSWIIFKPLRCNVFTHDSNFKQLWISEDHFYYRLVSYIWFSTHDVELNQGF